MAEWIAEYIEKRKEFSLHNRIATKSGEHVTCIYCLINPLGDSVLRASEMSGAFYKQYNEELLVESADIDDDFWSVRILVGKVYSGLRYLDSNMLSPDFEVEPFLSVARNLIEKIGLLNHVMQKKSRSAALGMVYGTSSADIQALINVKSGEEDELIKQWIAQNGWSSSTVESRVYTLGSSDLRLLYAYISRLVHGINRDEMLKRPSDGHYIAGYAYLVICNQINKVMMGMPDGVFSRNIKDEHGAALTEIENMWVGSGGLKSILTLTGFGVEGLEADVSEWMDGYNKKLEDVVAAGHHFFPKIAHSDGSNNVQE